MPAAMPPQSRPAATSPPGVGPAYVRVGFAESNVTTTSSPFSKNATQSRGGDEERSLQLPSRGTVTSSPASVVNVSAPSLYVATARSVLPASSSTLPEQRPAGEDRDSGEQQHGQDVLHHCSRLPLPAAGRPYEDQLRMNASGQIAASRPASASPSLLLSLPQRLPQ